MNVNPQSHLMRVLDRALIGALIFVAMILVGVQMAHAAVELIPSVGITRNVDSDDNEAKISGGLALRANMLPFLATEIGVAYREEDFFDDALTVRQWPRTSRNFTVCRPSDLRRLKTLAIRRLLSFRPAQLHPKDFRHFRRRR